MKRVLVAISACVALGALGQDKIPGMSFFALYERCKDSEFSNTSDKRSLKMQFNGFGCVAYSMALLDRRRFFNFSPPEFCLPKDIGMKDISTAIILLGDDILKGQREDTRFVFASAEGMAPMFFDVALKLAYPCPEKQ